METKAGRSDYNVLFTTQGLDPNEPIFILRGRDAVAGDAIRAYVTIADKAGVDTAVLESAMKQADAFDRFPEKRLPDGPDWTDAERKQLAYEFSRRAWRARYAMDQDTILMIDQLARDGAVAKMALIFEVVGKELGLTIEQITEGRTKAVLLAKRRALPSDTD